MHKKEFAEVVLNKLSERYGQELHTELQYGNLTELFVAVFLSPQCTDKQINRVTPGLFADYKTFEDYADADLKDLKNHLSGLNFYKTKARNLKKSAGLIVRLYNGEVPMRLEKLMVLPGVGRKVANVVLNEGFGIDEGIAVDTHCITVARRLRLSGQKNAERIERDLMRIIPKKRWHIVSNLFIALGRDTCKARKKECGRCILSEMCPSSDTVEE